MGQNFVLTDMNGLTERVRNQSHTFQSIMPWIPVLHGGNGCAPKMNGHWLVQVLIAGNTPMVTGMNRKPVSPGTPRFPDQEVNRSVAAISVYMICPETLQSGQIRDRRRINPFLMSWEDSGKAVRRAVVLNPGTVIILRTNITRLVSGVVRM